MTENGDSTTKVPYLSFQTFWAFIDSLAGKPLPPHIDRTILKGKSGSDQSGLVAALTLFGLIDNDKRVQPTFEKFVEADEKGRAKMLGEFVTEAYSEQMAVSERNGSEKDLLDSIGDTFDIKGVETRRKSMTFFLHAARKAGIDLSPHFPNTRTRQGRRSTPSGAKTTRKKRTPKQKVADEDAEPTIRGEKKVVDFGPAGKVTIFVDVKWLDLPTERFSALREALDAFDSLGMKELPAGTDSFEAMMTTTDEDEV